MSPAERERRLDAIEDRMDLCIEALGQVVKQFEGVRDVVQGSRGAHELFQEDTIRKLRLELEDARKTIQLRESLLTEARLWLKDDAKAKDLVDRISLFVKSDV